MAIIHELARNDDENMTALLKQSPYSVGEISHKKNGTLQSSFKVSGKAQNAGFCTILPRASEGPDPRPNRRKSLRDFYSYFLQFKVGISGYKF